MQTGTVSDFECARIHLVFFLFYISISAVVFLSHGGVFSAVKMCWSKNSKTLSWLGVLWGLLSLATLLTAFLSSVWLYTKEPIRFPNNDVLTTVTFKIGLWRICPTFKRTNATPRKYKITYFVYVKIACLPKAFNVHIFYVRFLFSTSYLSYSNFCF